MNFSKTNNNFVERTIGIVESSGMSSEVLDVLNSIPYSTDETHNKICTQVHDDYMNKLISKLPEEPITRFRVARAEAKTNKYLKFSRNADAALNLSIRNSYMKMPSSNNYDKIEKGLTDDTKSIEDSLNKSLDTDFYDPISENLLVSVSDEFLTLNNNNGNVSNYSNSNNSRLTSSFLTAANKSYAETILTNVNKLATGTWKIDNAIEDFKWVLGNKLPFNFSGLFNEYLGYDDFSKLIYGKSTSNPNLPRHKVDRPICYIKDLSRSSISLPAFEIIHTPSGLSDSVSHSFSSNTPTGRTAPLMGYDTSNRTLNFEFTIREDTQPHGIKETIEYLQGISYPEYDSKVNRINEPRQLISLGHISAIGVIVDLGVSYETFNRNNKFIQASISISFQVLTDASGNLPDKSVLMDGNPYGKILSETGSVIPNIPGISGYTGMITGQKTLPQMIQENLKSAEDWANSQFKLPKEYSDLVPGVGSSVINGIFGRR